jgi:uncharacterized protein (DUF433 family)
VTGYLRRVDFAADGYAQVIHLPRYRVADVTIDPDHAFGRPRSARGGARLDDVIELFVAGEPVDVVAAEFGLTRTRLRTLFVPPREPQPIGRSCVRILVMNCGEWSAEVHERLSLPWAVVTQLATRLGLDELAEHTAPEAATHFTLCCTGQAVVLGGPGVRFGEPRIPCAAAQGGHDSRKLLWPPLSPRERR